jgi:hypothetical protein
MLGMFSLVFFASFAWGLAIAILVQVTKIGQYICMHRSWIAYVVVGIGNTLLLLLLSTDGLVAWDHVSAIFFASSVPVVCRGIWQEYEYNRRQIENERDSATK